ncbi:MAG: hypothetical protein ACREO5_15000 [Candidatus Binatia bacterium]
MPACADTQTGKPKREGEKPRDERDFVLQGVFSHYGKERVAMVANHNRLGVAGAIREVVRVYGIAAAEITRLASRITKQQEIAWLSENPGSRAWTDSLRPGHIHHHSFIRHPPAARQRGTRRRVSPLCR